MRHGLGTLIVAAFAKRPVVLGGLSLAIVLSVIMGVGGIAALSLPLHWGTYTESECTRGFLNRNSSCSSKGRWGSDDGTISLPHTGLSGLLDSADGTVRASLREGGITTNGLFNIVTAEGEADGSIWQPWTVAVVLILVLTWQIWVNRPRRTPTGQIGRHAHPG